MRERGASERSFYLKVGGRSGEIADEAARMQWFAGRAPVAWGDYGNEEHVQV